MSREEKYHDAIRLIWRNLPGQPSTFSACVRDCGSYGARGGGVCLECAKKDLSVLVGEDFVNEYVQNIRDLRSLEEDMLEIILHP